MRLRLQDNLHKEQKDREAAVPLEIFDVGLFYYKAARHALATWPVCVGPFGQLCDVRLLTEAQSKQLALQQLVSFSCSSSVLSVVLVSSTYWAPGLQRRAAGKVYEPV